MKSKKFFASFIVFLIPLFVFCVSPKWLTELEAVYPSNDYIRMVGEGTTLKLAESNAVSAIAQNFNAKVKVINQAIKDYNSLITEDKSVTSKSYSFQQESKISSDVELLCLHFSEPYYDKKDKTYFVVGYNPHRTVETGEFRFKWDDAAQWFGVEKIVY